MNLVLEKIEMDISKFTTFNVWYDNTTKKFVVVENVDNGRMLVYDLSLPLDVIRDKFRDEIVEYCTGTINKDHWVNPGMIFMYGEFNRLLTKY